MFNTAGIGPMKPLLEHAPEDFDTAAVKVNQYGVFYGIVAAGWMMRDPHPWCHPWMQRTRLERSMARQHMRRSLQTPVQIASTAAPLASDDAYAINGRVVMTDDGLGDFK